MRSGSCGRSGIHRPKRKPMNGAAATWVSVHPNINSMKWMGKQKCSAPAYSDLNLDGNGEAKEDPSTTPSHWLLTKSFLRTSTERKKVERQSRASNMEEK
jgi:hypothetical protein